MKKSYHDEYRVMLQESAYQDADPQELMRSFQNGDDSAFESLYHKFKKPLYFFLLTMTQGRSELSEELTHEAFLKLYAKKDLFNFSVKFTTWFWTLARNTAIDELRKKNPIDWIIAINRNDEHPDDSLNSLVSDFPPLEGLLDQMLQKKKLREGISQLKPRHREVLTLRIVGELEYAEIAAIMGIKVNAVKALIFRATTHLENIILKNANLKVAT
jgi:RNA polymerase sigma-70 factor, ECF subfamily